VKGTEFVLAAVEQLRREGLGFEFRLIEGCTNSETLSMIADADIVGRTVISYIRPDLAGGFGQQPMPLLNANPETITDILRDAINQQSTREDVARAGHEWFARTHSTEAVVPLLMGHYEDIMRSPKPVDARVVQRLLEYQAGLKEGAGWPSLIPSSVAANIRKFNYVREADGISAAASSVLRYFLKKFPR
jgi:hypothetical protein